MNLKKLRGQLGYKQEEVADIIGCSRQTYVALEKGYQDISDRFRTKLKKLFRCSTAELYGMDIFKHPLESKEEIEYVIKMLQEELLEKEEDNFSINVKKYREAKGLSIDELAELSGITSVAIRIIEKGKTNDIRPLTIIKLANALDVTYEDLVGVK